MIETMMKVFGFLVDYFRSLSPDDRKAIKSVVVKMFEEIFRGFYRQSAAG